MQQELVQQIEQTTKDTIDMIHTALPAKVMTFNPDKCLATVKPYGKYTLSDGMTLEYPAITEVPVVFPFSASMEIGIAFPVKEGDDCLVILSEVELDEWRKGAKSEGPLRFDLTNAIAIPGLLRSGGGLLSKACSVPAVVVSASGSELMVSGSGIAISGNLKVDGNITYTGSISEG